MRGSTKWDWELVARRFRERRKSFGWTIDEVAARSALSRDTVLRVEKGLAVSDKSLHALRGTYMLFSAQLVQHKSDSSSYVSCSADNVRWMAATHRDHRGRPVKDIDYSFVDDANERKRRATLGYQRFFSGFIRAELPGGVMTSGMMEIYQPSWFDQHYGEEFIFCLSGKAVITVEDLPCVLEAGDSMIFDAIKLHRYAPVEGSVLPAIILFVVGLRPDEDERIARGLPLRDKWGV